MKKSFKIGQVFAYFLLFSISSLSFGQSAEKTMAEAAILANNGSAKNHVWVIGSANVPGSKVPNDPNFAINDNSKNAVRADVMLGTCDGTSTGGFKCTNIYLNEAISIALAANNNKIYIQEGLYYVNGPIVLEGRFGGYLPSYNDPSTGYLNQISIEGEGIGTRIMAASGYKGPLISVRSEYNTIRNLSLLIEQNESKVGLEIRKDNTAWSSTVSTIYPGDQRYNIFENLYIGKKARIKGSPDNIDLAGTAGVYGIVLENSNYSNTAIVYNKFKNISIHGVESAILFKKSTPTANIWSQDNTFENFDISQAARAIDLFQPQTVDGVTYYQPILVRNTFRRFTFQTATFSNNVVNNLNGNNNVFDDFKLADWGTQNSGIANRRVFVLTKDTKFTTISNSTVGGSGEIHADVNDITDSFDPVTNLVSNPVVNTYTQLINNNRAGVGISKLGFNGFQDASGNNKSLTKIEGRVQIAAQSGGANSATMPTATAGKLLTATDNLGNAIWKPLATNTPAAGLVLTATDNLGNATWQTVASNTAWSHIATKNINMNSFALTNNSNATPATNTAAGLRLDNNGNVRIGTTAPVATGEKLQVDGDVKANRAVFANSSDGVVDPTARLVVGGFPAINKTYTFLDYGDSFAKSVVLSVGTLRETAPSNTGTSRLLTFCDVPPLNISPNAQTMLAIEDRNDANRLRHTATANGASLFSLSDKKQNLVFQMYEIDQYAFFTMPKPDSYLAIGGGQVWPVIHKFEVINGSSKFGGNVFVDTSVGIGTQTFSYPETTGTVDYGLAVKGNVRAYMYKAITTGWSDFVFKKDYKLPSLATVEKHIEANGHLPNMPSEKEIVQDGINLGEMAKLQMQKIEELTLYLIEQNKQIETLTNKVKQLEKSKK